MANRDLIMSLAKVIISAAWADGQVNHDEINCLKDLLFRIDELTGREWASLEMYIEAPVDAHEREVLVEELVSRISNVDDKELALKTLDKVLAADGEVSESESAVAREIKEAIEGADIGIIDKLQSLMSGALKKRKELFETHHGRCVHLEDYLLNKVYYGVKRRKEAGEAIPEIEESRLRKLCLAAGLMAKIAKADDSIDSAERSAINFALKRTWKISDVEAELISNIALKEITADVDYYRLTREFYGATTEEERRVFLDLLFAIGAADGMVTKDEISEIENISRSLKVSRRDFANAKNRIDEKHREA